MLNFITEYFYFVMTFIRCQITDLKIKNPVNIVFNNVLVNLRGIRSPRWKLAHSTHDSGKFDWINKQLNFSRSIISIVITVVTASNLKWGE